VEDGQRLAYGGIHWLLFLCPHSFAYLGSRQIEVNSEIAEQEQMAEE
jgi:hypothetical protein